MTNQKHTLIRIQGFTIVELAIVISVIGILATITVVGYGNWRANAITAQLKSDLNGAVASMENARNFGNGYPLTVPTSFTPSSGVTLSGGGLSSGKSYCVTATSSSISYNLSPNAPALAGPCPIFDIDAGNKLSYPGTGTTLTDLSLNAASGSLMNGVGYNPTDGGALSFDGVDDVVSVNSNAAVNFSTNGSFTISAWIKPAIVTSSWRRGIIVQESYLTSGYRLGMAASGQPMFWTDQSGGSLTFSSSTSLVVNQWANLVVSYNNQQAYIYLNGVQAGGASGTYIAASNNVRLGASVSEPFFGLIGGTRFYNRALTTDEVKQNFDAIRSRYGL